MRRIKKTLTRANPIEIIVENQLPIGLTTMKFLLFIAFAAGLLILERPIIFGETFTEGYACLRKR
jgi:Ni/Fe-hydrogenase subunit HybB-like protein